MTYGIVMAWKKQRNLDDFFLMSLICIIKYSVVIVVNHISFFTSISFLLLYPVSSIIFLSRALLDPLLVAKISQQIHALGLFPCDDHHTHVPKPKYHKLSQTMIYYALCLPFLVTFSLQEIGLHGRGWLRSCRNLCVKFTL